MQTLPIQPQPQSSFGFASAVWKFVKTLIVSDHSTFFNCQMLSDILGLCCAKSQVDPQILGYSLPRGVDALDIESCLGIHGLLCLWYSGLTLVCCDV